MNSLEIAFLRGRVGGWDAGDGREEILHMYNGREEHMHMYKNLSYGSLACGVSAWRVRHERV